MARMIPPEIPAVIQKDSRRSAEIRVFEALKAQLPDDFTVYYSRPWRSRMPNGAMLDGEADFVVASSTWGILIIEVKGGIIDRDGATDRWTSTDRAHAVHEIRNPVAQVRRSKYVLLERLKQYPWFAGRYINIADAVILPDCSRPEFDLGIDMPLDMFAWAEHMGGLNKRLMRVLIPGGTRAVNCDPVDSDGMLILDELLARSFHLELRFGSVIGEQKKRLIELTEGQFWILEGLSRNLRMAVIGGAGTGKSVLAFEKATRLARHGFHTLFLCYNSGLAESFKATPNTCERLTVGTYHSFAMSLCRRAGIDLEMPSEEADITAFYQTKLPELVFELALADRCQKYDAIIIDEAQDFAELWWTSLESVLLSRDTGLFYVFYDDNQNIYGRLAAFLTTFPSFRLGKNLRNARGIFDIVAPYYKGESYESGNSSAGEVSFHPEIHDSNGLVRLLNELIESQHIPPKDIAVLSCLPVNASRLSLPAVASQLQSLNRSWSAVRFDSVSRFKGLESPVVVLTDLSTSRDDDALLYTAFSRAQLKLCIVGTPRIAVQS
ncbi:MAG: NERD domain-containing protein [Bryobacteraceae bacterium]